MLAIRFKRVGRRHQPAFRIVVSEKRSKRDSKSVDDIGFYNPVSKEFGIKEDKLKHWLSVGAKPTLTVHNLLVNKKLINAPKLKIKIRKSNKNGNDSSNKNLGKNENIESNK